MALAYDQPDDVVFDAIANVETLGAKDRDHVVGDNGKAVGRYQLHKEYVDDADRYVNPSNWLYDRDTDKFICKDESKRKYSYSDRTDPTISREIVKSYLTKYGQRYKEKTGKMPSFEVLVRMHNGGGSRGWRNPNTIPYYEKALKYIN